MGQGNDTTQWAPCANDAKRGGWCYLPTAPCKDDPGKPCAKLAVVRYGFQASADDPTGDSSFTYHYVHAPAVQCSELQFGTPTENPRYAKHYPRKCDYQMFADHGGYVHPAQLNYTWCAQATQRGDDIWHLDCDTGDRILYARFGTPPDATPPAGRGRKSLNTGYVYRMVKGKFSCSEAFFGNTFVDMTKATCALSTLQPVQMNNKSNASKVSHEYCANAQFNCTVPTDANGVTITSLSVKEQSDFFVASTGKHVGCNADNYNVPWKGNDEYLQSTKCMVWSGLSNQFVNPVGKWVNVASCNNCALSQSLQWGVSKTEEHSITHTWSWSLTNTISFGFSFFGFSFSDSISIEVSHSVAQEMSTSLERSVTSTCSAACPTNSSEWNMWQWQMDIGEVCNFGDVCPFTVYSCHFICRSGTNGTKAPRCPLTQCADAECNTCLPEPKQSELQAVTDLVI